MAKKKEIPDSDWKIIKKYPIEDIKRRRLIEQEPIKGKKLLKHALTAIVLFILVGSTYVFWPPFSVSIQIAWFIFGFPFLLSFFGYILSHEYELNTVRISNLRYPILTRSVIIALFVGMMYAISIYDTDNALAITTLGGLVFVYGYRFGDIFSQRFIGSKIKQINSFDYVYLKHDKKIENFQDILFEYIRNYHGMKGDIFVSDDDSSKIRDLKNWFRIGLKLSDKKLGFFVFLENGKTIFQDELCLKIQNKLSFLLENGLNFNVIEDTEEIESMKDGLLDLMNEYIEPSSLKVFYDAHKKEVWSGVSIIILTIISYSVGLFTILTDLLVKPFVGQLVIAIIPVTLYALWDYFRIHKKS